MAWLVAPGNHVAALDTRVPSTVGSHPACTLVVREELGVAPQHYRIVPFGDEAAELHSLAPTGMEVKLNGIAVGSEPCPLSDGDTISTGNLKLIFRLSDPALDESRPAAILEKQFSGEPVSSDRRQPAAPLAAPVPLPEPGHAPAPVPGASPFTPVAPPELAGQDQVVPVPDVPPVVPVDPAATGASPPPLDPYLPPEEPAPEAVPEPAAPPVATVAALPQESPSRPNGLVLPQKKAPQRAAPGSSGRRSSGKKFLGGGVRAILTGAVALWVLAGAYAFIDPLRNVVNDLIGFNPIPPATMEAIEKTVEAKNPSRGDQKEDPSPSGVAGQE